MVMDYSSQVWLFLRLLKMKAEKQCTCWDIIEERILKAKLAMNMGIFFLQIVIVGLKMVMGLICIVRVLYEL